jgi:hypothetical protein
MALCRGTLTAWIAVGLVLSGVESASAQAEKLDLGFRWQFVPPGEGSILLVTAPPEFCVDDSHELQVNQYTPLLQRPIVRLMAGPSPCEWQIVDVENEGFYRAVIRSGRFGPIVASGETSAGSGGVTVLIVTPIETKLEGRITFDGVPFQNAAIVAPLRLHFAPDHAPWSSTSIRPDGQYEATLGRLAPGERVCLSMGTTQSMNRLGAQKCEHFGPGRHVVDLDFHMPEPGLIRVGIPPNPGASPTAVFVLQVEPLEPVGPDPKKPLPRMSSSGLGFRAVDGLRTEFLAQRSGRYEVSVIDANRTTVTATRITLSVDEPLVTLTLRAQ